MSEFHPIHTLQPWLERAWMDRYLARELTEPESDWWEAYILAHPHLAAELEADEAVRAHTAAAGAALTAPDPAGSPTHSATDHGSHNDSRTGTRPPGLRGRYSWQQYAATALILILSAAALPQYLRKPPPDVMPVDVYTLNTERSGSAPEWIIEDNGGADSEWVVVNVPNEPGLRELLRPNSMVSASTNDNTPYLSFIARRDVLPKLLSVKPFKSIGESNGH